MAASIWVLLNENFNFNGKIHITDDNQMFVGTQLKSNDGGQTFTELTGADAYADVSFTSGQYAYATGENGIILKLILNQSNQYTITLDPNGGIIGNNNLITFNEDDVYVVLTSDQPTRNDYVFTGWNTAYDGSGDVLDETTLISSSFTAYAQWNILTSLTNIKRKEIYIFPNPVTDNCFISGITVNTPIQIYNTSNQLIKELVYLSTGLGLSDLEQGIYFVKIESSRLK